MANVNMTQAALIVELEKEGLKVSRQEISAYLCGELNYRKKGEVLSKADEIIRRYENCQAE